VKRVKVRTPIMRPREAQMKNRSQCAGDRGIIIYTEEEKLPMRYRGQLENARARARSVSFLAIQIVKSNDNSLWTARP